MVGIVVKTVKIVVAVVAAAATERLIVFG